ncbi:MAG TPA: hypothetical protein VHM02_10065 [Thermoanaerobaculia bacterium]|nr:hypothetical protein [Thermoanaerobaculia bacterium]
MPAPIRDWVLTAHAETELRRRGLGVAVLATILESPERRRPFRPGRDVLESRLEVDGKTYLIRVFVDVDRSPAEVVTAYRTSKLAKYWGDEP